jgi:hypothetical protein
VPVTPYFSHRGEEDGSVWNHSMFPLRLPLS